MKRSCHFSLMCCILFVSLSCEGLFLDYRTDNSAVSVFESFWETLDERYPYFDLKGVDWEETYNIYRPAVNNHMTDEELWTVLTSMLAELRDGHTNLVNNDHYWSVLNDETLYPESLFDFDGITRHYLDAPHSYQGPVAYGFIGNTGYIYCEDFRNVISGEDADFLIDYFSSTDGIIIDIRNNTGGNAANGDTLQTRFMTGTITVEYVRYKTGKGHDDFSKPTPVVLSPEGPLQYVKPVVVLTNSKTYSSGTLFASRMSLLPNVTVIGEATGGGAGTPRYIDLPNGWLLRYSSTRVTRTDGYEIENGVPVDAAVSMDEIDFNNSIDTQLEYAVEFLSSL